MSSTNTSDDVSDAAKSVPDECPLCGEDLTVNPETDVQELRDARKVAGFEDHIEQNHPIVYHVGSGLAALRIWIGETIDRVTR